MLVRDILSQIVRKNHITQQQSQSMIEEVMSGEVSPVFVAALLSALHTKGETPEEIAGAVQGMRAYMQRIQAPDTAVDTCGTGGDGLQTFNISTTVAFVVAVCGVPVAKHGNKAASSTCGSADVLQELGVNIMLQPHQAEDVLTKAGIVFLFAPVYHPSMKHVGPVRKELGIRTIFNFLGPFSNPAGTKRQIVGVPSKEIADTLAQVVQLLEYDHVMIISNGDGMDEIGLSSATHVYEIKSQNSCLVGRQAKSEAQKETIVNEYIINPQKLGFERVPLDRLKGGTAQENAKITRDILDGKKGAKRDIVILNAAYALIAAGKVTKPDDGIKLAEEAIDSGKAKEKLAELIKLSQKHA
jgi:anthranilate phosphoribosyltransferase